VLAFSLYPPISRGIERDHGHLVVVKEPISGEAKVRLLRRWQRVPGSPTAKAVGEDGRPVAVDTMALLWQTDLASLDFPSFLTRAEIDDARRAAAAATAGLERFPQAAPHLTPLLTRLRAEIARAESGDRKLKGQWFTPAQWAQFQEKNKSTISRGTLVLKNGTRYHDVEIVAANPKELRIMHTDGAVVIPMSEVPVEFQREYLKNLTPPAK